MIVGKTMMARTIAPASTEYPVEYAPNAGAIFATKGTIIRTPQTPKTTEGMPERRSTMGLMVSRIRRGAYSDR